MPEAISRLFETILASTKTHKWWWAGGGGATLVAVVALLLVFGVFGDLFGPSGATICKVAVDRSVEFGAVPADAVSSDSGKKSDVSGRRTCTASSGSDTYIVTADLKCKKLDTDLAFISWKKSGRAGKEVKVDYDKSCLSLYAVERADGLSTYQKRKEEPDEAEAALPAADQTAMPDSGQTAAPASGQNALGSSDLQPATGGNNGQSDTQQQQQPPQQ